MISDRFEKDAVRLYSFLTKEFGLKWNIQSRDGNSLQLGAKISVSVANDILRAIRKFTGKTTDIILSPYDANGKPQETDKTYLQVIGITESELTRMEKGLSENGKLSDHKIPGGLKPTTIELKHGKAPQYMVDEFSGKLNLLVEARKHGELEGINDITARKALHSLYIMANSENPYTEPNSEHGKLLNNMGFTSKNGKFVNNHIKNIVKSSLRFDTRSAEEETGDVVTPGSLLVDNPRDISAKGKMNHLR